MRIPSREISARPRVMIAARELRRDDDDDQVRAFDGGSDLFERRDRFRDVDPGEVDRVVVTLTHACDEIGLPDPQSNRAALARQVDRQGGPPGPGTEDRDLGGRVAQLSALPRRCRPRT